MILKNDQQKNNLIVGGTMFIIGSALFWFIILKNQYAWTVPLKAAYFLGIICFSILFIFQNLFEKLKETINLKEKLLIYTYILAAGTLGYLLIILVLRLFAI